MAVCLMTGSACCFLGRYLSIINAFLKDSELSSAGKRGKAVKQANGSDHAPISLGFLCLNARRFSVSQKVQVYPFTHPTNSVGVEVDSSWWFAP